jgi:Family of unknown function (DUF6519)/Chaperone of endosialidase
MKGDFTRFTFQPSKQYTSVLMQQGRLQLDADWNEQMSIFAYLNQVQARDMIGVSAGTSQTLDGFAIKLTPDNKDLIITPGRFYLNGLLCELVAGSEVKIQKLETNLILVNNWLIDGQKFVPGQWIEISQKDKITKKILCQIRLQIELVDDQLQTLRLRVGNTNFSSWVDDGLLSLRRVTTYQTQLDYPNPPDNLDKNNYLVYLDAWQRHITTLEDPSIREVALQSPDTATRTKTVWQIKLQLLDEPLDLSSAGNRQKDIIELIEDLPEWQKITGGNTNRNSLFSGRKISLIASTDQADGRPGSYQGNDNRLYRIEVHFPGGIDQATFKWSRENGSIVSAIDNIENNIINLISPIKEVHKLFENEPGKPLPWLEIIDEEQELKNIPGALVQLVKAKNNQLEFNLSKVRGKLPTATKSDARAKKIKVRRWHDDASGEILITKDFINIEDGIRVKFETGEDSQEFRTGDFWLIPARESTQSIEWSRDDLQRFQPQLPQGIYHQYTPIALVKTVEKKNEDQSSIIELQIEDVRTKFPTLVNCFDKTGDSIQGSLGVGVKDILATLHVKGTTKKQPDGSTIDLPIAKFDSKDGETQLLIDPNGKIVIGTEAFSPDMLNIRGNTKIDGNANVVGQANFRSSIQLTSPTGSTGFTIQSDKDLSLIATENLILRGKRINIIGAFQFDQTRFNNLGINMDPDLSSDAKLQVNGDVEIGDLTNTVTIIAPTSNSPVKFVTTNQQGYQFNGSARFTGTDSFVKIEPPIDDNDAAVQFTTNGQSYQFDKRIDLVGGIITDRKIIGRNNLTIESAGQIKLSSSNIFIPDKLFIGNDTDVDLDSDVRLYVAGKADVNSLITDGLTTQELKVNQLKVFSSQAFKNNIVELSKNEARDILRGLNPIKFTYKTDKNNALQLGFIAEDVPEVISSLDRQTINPMNIIAALTKISKDHQDMLIFLNRVIKDQKVEIDSLKTKVKSLESKQS